jgi:arginase
MKTRPKLVEIIGAPLDLGCNLRGANIAPATVRIAGLQEKLASQGIKSIDGGDVAVPLRETLGEDAVKDRFLTVIAAVCDDLFNRVYTSLQAERFPLIIGGDHSIAVGTIKGAGEFFHRQGGQLGLVWIDAHADMNTPATSPSGNLHGMPLAAVLGLGHDRFVHVGGCAVRVRPENVALIGIRNLDEGEKEFVRQTGIRYYSMTDIDQRGMYACISEAMDHLSQRCNAVHLSFDMDGVDPLYAPGVSTPVTGGLTYREAHLALEVVAARGILRSMEFVEINPMYDSNHQTSRLCIELAMSALGKAIV